ncbi:MAG: peptidase T [Galactobacillus timonensis]|nr:peptidase T [Galactobacillus timonensis]
MTVAERLIRYCKVWTTSDPESHTHPSSMREFDLAKILVEELKELGIADAHVDEHCYVYGHLDSNVVKDVPTVGFIAHMDTAPDYSGKDVKPRIIENFDGKDIDLGNGVVMKMDSFPYMRDLKGKTLIVTDGTTLLGADDKAGIAAIMDALEYWKDHPEAEHGRIAVAFTPDEEIGEGADLFDLKEFGAAFAYTVDGDSVRGFSDENFNAGSAEVKFTGFAIHPGDAKNKLINAAAAAAKFQSLLPEALTPEHTEGKEGFISLRSMSGDVEHAQLSYILRDHNAGKLQKMMDLMAKDAEWINAFYGEGTCEITFAKQYRNMKEILDQHPQVSRIAWEAMNDLGLDPYKEPIRGGTDGATLTYQGLPCPNLGAGGNNFHGRYEYCVVEELETASKLVRRIAQRTVEDSL